MRFLFTFALIALLFSNGKTQSEDSIYTISPNPFETSTEITLFNLDKDTVSLVLFDGWGQEVSEILSDTVLSGTQFIAFSPDSLYPGLYIYILSINSDSHVGRLTKTGVISNLDPHNTTREEIMIMPNPAVEEVTIKWKGDNVDQLYIADYSGRLLERVPLNGNNQTTIGLNKFRPGLYLFSFYSSDGIFLGTEKVLVK